MGNRCNCIGRPQVDDDQPLLPGYVTDNAVSMRGPPPPYEVSKQLVRPLSVKKLCVCLFILSVVDRGK